MQQVEAYVRPWNAGAPAAAVYDWLVPGPCAVRRARAQEWDEIWTGRDDVRHCAARIAATIFRLSVIYFAQPFAVAPCGGVIRWGTYAGRAADHASVHNPQKVSPPGSATRRVGPALRPRRRDPSCASANRTRTGGTSAHSHVSPTGCDTRERESVHSAHVDSSERCCRDEYRAS